MPLNTLKDLLVDELSDLYDAENQLVKTLPKLADAASNTDLKKSLTDYWQQTKGHVARLEHAFEILSVPSTRKTCHAMRGLARKGTEVIARGGAAVLRDAGLIGAVQRAEHYEISAYGTARSMAHALEEDEVADLLQQNLSEEQVFDKKLSALSETVNLSAILIADGTEDPVLEEPDGDDEHSAT